MNPRALHFSLPPIAGAVSAALLCILITAPSAQAETLKARYALSLMGLPIGSAYANGVLEPKNYRIDIGMRTSGLANLVNNSKGAASASGGLLDCRRCADELFEHHPE